MKSKYITYILIAIVIFLSFSLIANNRNISRFKSQISKFKLENQAFKEEINDQGERLVEQEQVILTQQEAIENGLVELNNFKKLSNQIKVVTETLIDTIVVTNHDTVVSYINGINYLKLPAKYDYTSEFINFDLNVSVEGLSLNSINLPNESLVSIGYKKQGLFKPLLPVIEIKNTNPYIKTSKLQNISIVEEKRLIDDKKFLIGIGLVFGFLIK